MTTNERGGTHGAADGEANLSQTGRDDMRGETRGGNIVLNPQAFSNPTTEAHYARLVAEVSAAAQGRPVEEVERLVADALERSGMELSPVEQDRFVEQIVRGDGLVAVSRDDGEVLQGAADAEALQNPSVAGHADPANPDRPSYS